MLLCAEAGREAVLGCSPSMLGYDAELETCLSTQPLTWAEAQAHLPCCCPKAHGGQELKDDSGV